MPRQTKRARANQEGSIYKRVVKRKDGSTFIRWEAAISLGYDANGNRKRKTLYGSTQTEVRQKMTDIQQQIRTGTWRDDRRSLQQYLEEWLQHKALELKPRSLEFYRFYIEKYIAPDMGAEKLQKLSTQQVRRFLVELNKKVSADCANKCRLTLNNALGQALKDAIIARNPVAPIRPFKLEGKARDIEWSPSEVMLFLNAAMSHRLYAAFYLALSTGMRHGEVLGLHWEDFSEETILVRHSLVRLKGGYVLNSPKTERSIRKIVLDSETMTVLNQHRLLQQAERSASSVWAAKGFSDLVFTDSKGDPIHPRNFDRVWYALQDKARAAYVAQAHGESEKQMREAQVAKGEVLPRIRFHDLRHMHVSLLNRAGVASRTISDRIGHTDPAFTLRRYAHVFEDQRREAAIPLSQLLSSAHRTIN